MDITREVLEERRAALMGDMNAIGGALQNIDWLLEKLDESEPVEGEVVDE